MKTNTLRCLCIVSLCTALSLLSCITTPIDLSTSSHYLGNKSLGENLGTTSGSDTTWSLFGLWMIGRPDWDKAIDEAIEKKGGDALINVKCYRETSWFVLFSLNRVIVEGEAVKYESPTVKTK